MTELLPHLIESLREELTQYGEMLALLDQQQALVVSRRAEDLVQTAQAVTDQGAVIQTARRQRERAQRELAHSWQQPDDASLAALTALMPADYRPLVQALVRENNQLLVRVQQRARQNHLLLNRCLELMQRFLNSLCPAGTPVYNDSGRVLKPALLRGPLYEAVG